jgi:VanZ family protein
MLRLWLNSPRVHFLSFTWALSILLLSATPGKELPSIDLAHIDKFFHALVYGILAVLLFLSFKRLGIESLFAVVVIVSAYGFLMEWMQGTFFEGRFFDVMDGIANTIGAILGIVIFERLDRTFLK